MKLLWLVSRAFLILIEENEIGFLPLFKNEIPGFSLEERTVPEYWWSGNSERDPWEWREIIARRGEIAYGKFFDKKAGFISKKWFPYFANYRRDGYDFDALWDDEKASLRQKKIMDLFAEGNAEAEYYSNELKQKAGFGKEGDKGFDGVITTLQMQTYLCLRDFRQRKNKKGESYGWPIAIYSMPDIILAQMSSDINSLFSNANNVYVEFKEPNLVRLSGPNGINFSIDLIRNYPITVFIEHNMNLMTIPPTKMNIFEELATADVAKFLFKELMRFDGLETVFANVDLKLSDLETEASKRDDVIARLEEGRVSAANDNQPMIMLI